jgi:hypothetical protein
MQPKGTYPMYVRLIHYFTIHQCKPLHQQAKEKKSYDHINQIEKGI